MTTEAERALSAEVLFHRRVARPGMVIDIGAHSGDFTFSLRDIPDLHLVAVEPLPKALEALQARAAADGNAVRVAGVALSDQPGSAQLVVPVLEGGPVWQWASISKDFQALRKDYPEIVGAQEFTITVTTLDLLSDQLGLAQVTAIKLDAEGAEYEVLRGGRQLLRRERPILSIELEERHRPGCTYAIPAFLDGLDYECFFELNGHMVPFSRFDRAVMQRGSPSPAVHDYSDPYVNCFYFLPAERKAELLARHAAHGSSQIGAAPCES
jgi:FkbM family methyltransferase